MKRDIKVNYGVIGEVVNKLRIYKEALTTIREVVESINEKIESENSGKAVEELKKIGKKINKDLKSCKNEIEDLYELFNGYNNEMQEIIRPNNINEIMQVDRNDIYWNMKSIFNACDAVGNIKYNTDYYGGYDYGFGDSEEEKRNKEENYARIQEIWCIIDRYKRRLDSKKEELQRIYDTKIIPYENLDDEYGRKASDLYSNYSSFGEALWDGISSCITDVVDIVKGITSSVVDMLKGIGGILLGAVKMYVVSTVGQDVGIIALAATGDSSIYEYCVTKEAEYENTIGTMVKSILKDPFI